MHPSLTNRLSQSVAALICAGLSLTATFGQALSIAKKPDKTFSVTASAPANNPGVLQGSDNLSLWIDLKDPVTSATTYNFDPTGLTQQRYFRLKPSTGAPEPINLMIIGDSMASECCGWGQGIPNYTKGDSVNLINYGTAWYSTKIFMQSSEWDKMLLIQPHYVMIQFGWMDGSDDPDRHTTLEEFRANLQTIVNAVRSWNGIPILITLHAGRYFDGNGKIVIFPQPHSEVLKEVAAEMNVHLIDLYKLSIELFNQLGPDGVKFMLFNPQTPSDLMHLSPLGATWVARLVANHLPPAMGPYLRNVLEHPPKPPQ